MPRKPPADLVRHVVAAIGLSLTAHEVAAAFVPDDEDRDTVLEQLECAGLELARVMRFLYPEWDRLSEDAMASRALKVFRQNRPPDLHEEVEGPPRLARLLEDACDHGTRAMKVARSAGFCREDKVAGALSNGLSAIFCAVHLLDPKALPRWILHAEPAERVKLAAMIEMIELDIEESRAAARAGALPQN